jgi:ubiquinone/menaquinone biosynthesis C-methylase UbiE
MYQEFERDTAPLADVESPGLPGIPEYLTEIYWWAYIHPRAVRLFDRMMAVDLILFGNYRRLRDAALTMLPSRLPGKTLQVACVYGDFTSTLVARLAPGAALDVVDVVPIQLHNLRRKLPAGAPVSLFCRDATMLGFPPAAYEQVILFFLLHEQPESVRRATLAEALRVVKPGGQLVVVDYHRPHRFNPLHLLMKPLLARLEPFALDLWRADISSWLPQDVAAGSICKTTFFGGLYQLVTIRR